MGESYGRQIKAFSAGNSCNLFTLEKYLICQDPRPTSNHLKTSHPEAELLRGTRVVDAPSLEVFKVGLDRALGNLI